MEMEIGDELVSEAADGKSKEVDELIAQGADVNYANDSYRWTALMAASKAGHANIVASLLSAKADVNQRDIDKWTALMLATKGGCAEVEAQLCAASAVLSEEDNDILIGRKLVDAAYVGMSGKVDALIAQGADVNHMDVESNIFGATWKTALMAASSSGQANIVASLLSAKADVCQTGIDKRTALMAASKAGHANIVASLLSAKADVNQRDIDKWTALMLATKEGYAEVEAQLCAASAVLSEEDKITMRAKEMGGKLLKEAGLWGGKSEEVNKLIAQGADVNYGDFGGTALMKASDNGHGSIVAALIAAKADVNGVTRWGSTALMAAIESGRASIVASLLSAKGDANQRDKYGETPLRKAITGDHYSPKVEEQLREAGAVLSEEEKGHAIEESLFWAARNGKSEEVNVLIEQSVDVNYVHQMLPKNGRTALMNASSYGHAIIVDSLLSAKADVNKTDKNGRTALMNASSYGHAIIVDALLSAKADVNKTDKNGETALGKATEGGHSKVVAQLRAANAVLSEKEMGDMLLEEAKRGGGEKVDELVAQGANVSYEDELGNTALRNASDNGHCSVVALLLSAKADVNKVDGEGRTALGGAIMYNNAELEAQLRAAGAALSEKETGIAMGEKLVKAVEDGRPEDVNELIVQGADVNYATKYGLTALIKASDNGYDSTRAGDHKPSSIGRNPPNTDSESDSESPSTDSESDRRGRPAESPSTDSESDSKSGSKYDSIGIVATLLQAKADVNYTDLLGRTALMEASYKGHASIVASLLLAKADVNKTDWREETALGKAITRGHAELVVQLQAAGAVVSEIEKPIVMCVELLQDANDGRSEKVDDLIAHGADVNYTDLHGRTALMKASYEGHASIVASLLLAKADVNKTDGDGGTALMKASYEGHASIVASLLLAKADVNKTDWREETALGKAITRGHAVLGGHLNVAAQLYAAGAVPSEKEKDSVVWSLQKELRFKALNGKIEEVSTLIAIGADVNGLAYCGRPVLMALLVEASRCVPTSIVDALLSAKADVNKTDTDGHTALMVASIKGHAGIVDALLSAKADVNTTATNGMYDGQTALMGASHKGHASIAHRLILAGTNLHVANKYGRTAAQLAKKKSHNRLAAQLEAIAPSLPSSLTTTQTATKSASTTTSSSTNIPVQLPELPQPQSIVFLAAGIPLQSHPQPACHSIAYNEETLVTVIGPWIRDVALPLAASDPKVKELIFTIISHTFTLTFTNPVLAEQFFKEYLLPAAQSAQDAMPAQLDDIARGMEVNFALAPALLRDTPEQKVELNQGDYLAFMRPEHSDVVKAVLAECIPKLEEMRKEAEVAVADIADDGSGESIGISQTYTNAKVHSLPTVSEVYVAALCLISTFIYTHLQTTRPDLCNNPEHSGTQTVSSDESATDTTFGDIRWPDVKTMLRMFAKLREDYADLSQPWAALLDTVRFSLVSKTPDQHANFVQRFLPKGVEISSGGSAGDRDGGDTGADEESAAGASKLHPRSERDTELTVVRAKSTLDVPDATVKQELWNLVYTPTGLTFESMLGAGGLQEIEGADRWEEYGDVKWRGEWNRKLKRFEHEKEPRNHTTTFRPRNPLFQQALTAARNANPTISSYVWGPALKLIAHPSFAAKPVAMVIEVQLYLEEFLKYRKVVHCYYKITRAPHLASLAQDCRKYAKNPELAFDQEKVDVQARDALISATTKGDLDTVKRLLAYETGQNAVLARSEGDGKTALMVAVEEGHTEVIELLISANANLDAVSDVGKTAPLIALEAGRIDIFEQLLARGADLNAMNKCGQTSLMISWEAANTDVVDQLIAAAITHASRCGGLTLVWAAETGNVEVVGQLIAAGADVNAAGTCTSVEEAGEIMTALMHASRAGHTNVVGQLIAAGADVNAAGTCTSVEEAGGMYASQAGHANVVGQPIAAGADVNAAGTSTPVEEAEEIMTALMYASQAGHTNVVRQLIASGADVNAATKDIGWTALMVASDWGHVKVVEQLIAASADLNTADIHDGETALMLALENKNVEVIEHLVAAGADLNGKTELMLASITGHNTMVQQLITAGVDINTADRDGKTALMLASGEGHVELVEQLIAAAANINTVDKDGKTALMLASLSDSFMRITIDGENARMQASGEQHAKVVGQLIAAAADINAVNKDGKTALMLASVSASYKSVKVVDVLIAAGANIHSVDQDGKTALMLARASPLSKRDAIRRLIAAGSVCDEEFDDDSLASDSGSVSSRGTTVSDSESDDEYDSRLTYRSSSDRCESRGLFA